MALPDWMKPSKDITSAFTKAASNVKNKVSSVASALNQTNTNAQSVKDDVSRAYQNYRNQQRANAVNQLTAPQDRFDTIYSEIANIRSQLTQPTQAFSYDPTTDPQYQAALRQAQANAQRASGDIAADMNRRGLLNSTITQDRATQAAQREYGRVSDTLLPQMMQQAYQRYIDQQNRQRQALLDQLGLLETQYDIASGERQYADAQRAAEAEARAREREANWNAYMDIVRQTGNLGTGPKQNWQLLVEEALQGAPTLDYQKFQEDIRQFGIDTALKRAGLEQEAKQFAQRMGLDWAQLNQRQKEFAAEEAWRQKNYDLDVAREQRLAQGDTGRSIDAKTSSDNYNIIIDDMDAALSAGTLTKEMARQLVQANRDNLTDSDYRRALDWINDNL